MTISSENLVLEHLRAIRADIADLKQDMREVRADIISLRMIMGEFIKTDGRRESSIAGLEHRVERLERRLELADA